MKNTLAYFDAELLKAVIENIIMLNTIMLNAIVLNVIMLNALMLNTITLNAVMLSVVMQNVVAPLNESLYYKTFYGCKLNTHSAVEVEYLSFHRHFFQLLYFR